MSRIGANLKSWIARNRYSALVQYGGAALAVWVALSLWTFSGVLHRYLFVLLLAAVLFTARFLGFGPAVFCSLVSTACLDFFAVPPYFSFSIRTGADLERLTVFLAISVFAGSMARQKTLAESRADRTTREMAAIVEYSSDAIFSTRPDGTITSWNRAAEHLYGYTAEEAVGLPVARLAPPERRDEVEQNRLLLNGGGHVASYRTERMRKDGTRWPVLLSVSSLRNARGEIVGASAIARDISVEKQSQEAVRRSEKLATAGRLAASIAHEINNPLEAVINLLYLARHDSSHAGEYLTLAEQEVGRVAQLAQQTLGFVRDASSPGSMDPAAIMDEILQLYSRKLEGRQIHVTRRYRSLCQISGYSGELRQLLANLLVNAVEAMADGGSLQVRVATGRDWSNGREGVRITVADNGSGIPRDKLRQIFEPFYTTKKDTGTGLGLWVSLGIVQKHGGSIRVRSRTDGRATGTVFSIFLPQRHEISRVA
ncbi:MAG TPA: PAS domain S-box protein [Terriglobales bacterium]|jgi:PAS domain S-box-containing protein|nr:PAS domain S-box protein [Terriglobales bacterium]